MTENQGSPHHAWKLHRERRKFICSVLYIALGLVLQLEGVAFTVGTQLGLQQKVVICDYCPTSAFTKGILAQMPKDFTSSFCVADRFLSNSVGAKLITCFPKAASFQNFS